MGQSAPWIVGALLTAFVAVAGPAGILVARVQRRSTTADQKITETGQALSGFRDLVGDLQEERAALKQEVAALKAENAALKKRGTK